LGASSGFGGATAAALAEGGRDVFGVHLDRKGTLHLAEEVQERIRKQGRKAVFFNVNASDPEARAGVLEEVKKQGGPGSVRVVLHSLAFGTLKPYLADRPEDSINSKQMEMTLDVMAHSLVYWVQDLFWGGLLARGGRVFAMTSAGSSRIWKSYGAVSAAKCALESHIRQLSVELAPHGITANAVRAGVTDTPALRKIPGHERMIEEGQKTNPHRRLTTPEDVARAIAALCDEKLSWMTGNVLGVDGGEILS
jgi:NAD(P)-dependent dehydrogenase (short-subunit alcohol dehydrogenase family)